MQHYTNTVTNYSGDRVVGAVATVTNLNGTPATLYADANGTLPIGYQVTTDPHGQFSFYASPGRYNIAVTGTGITAYTLSDIQISNTNYSVSVKDFGAVGDGVTDDTAAVSAFNTAGGRVVPSLTLAATVADTTLDGPFIGPGQIKTNAGNKRAPFFSAIKAAPASLSNYNSVITTFNGDYSKCQFAVEHRITGIATLGQPLTGYQYTPEASPHFTYLFNSSGWNQSTAGNSGRTSATAYRTVVSNAGQGDAVCYNGSGFVQGTLAGSTNFLANPAVSLFNGDCAAGTDGVYLNPYETILADNGFDVAAIGIVLNFNRTNGIGAKTTVWEGIRLQNIGSAACNSVLAATGKWNNGIDLSMATTDFGANQAAISLKSGQRIYFNNTAVASGTTEANWTTTTYNQDYISYNSTGGDTGIHFSVAGIDSVSVRSDALIINGANGIVLKSTGLLRFSGTSQYTTGTSTASFVATNKPGATTGAGPANWLTVILGGVSYQIPCWLT